MIYSFDAGGTLTKGLNIDLNPQIQFFLCKNYQI